MKSLLVFFLIWCGVASASTSFRIEDLQVDYQDNPMTLESERPVFSWKMKSENPASLQSAYEIKVVDESGNIVWDSGKVKDDISVAVSYDGSELKPTTRYEWEVSVWSESGSVSNASSYFETGFMVEGDSEWPNAQWIGGGATDLPLYAQYLTVFRVGAEVQLDEASGSNKAAFLFGGNDFRLKDRNLNIQNVENEDNESFVAVELDVSPLFKSGDNALLNIYRVGYTPEDRSDKPFTSLSIPKSLINLDNAYDKHSVDIRSLFGLLTIYVNGRSEESRLTPYDPNTPPHQPQGLNINPVAFGGSAEPAGNPGDYISFPALGDVGFWVKKGQKARFSRLTVRNFREPENLLFAAGKGAPESIDDIFDDRQVDGLTKTDSGVYEVGADNDDFIALADPSRNSAPMLRTEFNLKDKRVKKARLYATARGIYELYLNGSRVGDDYFAPGLTQYNKHHPYQSYDVTQALRSGSANALGAWLGEGWWSGNATYNGIYWNFFGDRQSLLAKLVVTYEDGSVQEINTKPDQWKVLTEGPIRYASFFQGEVYDARLEEALEGWSQAGYDDGNWSAASIVPLEGTAFLAEHNPNPGSQEIVTSYEEMDLVGRLGNAPSVVKTLVAKSVDEVRDGVFVYDMGQNMVGFPRIELSGEKRGQRVVARYAEMLYPDLPEHAGQVGMVMMENIRAALAHDTYFTKGGDEVFQPRFTFHGYRYIEISGIDEALPLHAVQGKVVSSVSELTSSYKTSNDKVNKLWENITWSMRSNFLSIPTDTPARNERMGWSGDINVFAPTATLMADVNPFLKRHLLAMRDLQGENGRFTDVAPVGGGFGGILWGSAGITIPWELYQQYADDKVLSVHYSAMKRYMDYLWSKRDPKSGVLVEGPLGDWLSPVGQKNDNTLLWEAYHVYSLDIMANIAGILGERDEQIVFRDRYEKRKAFFNDTYIDEQSGKTIHSGMVAGLFADPSKAGQINESLKGALVDTQASYAVPIALGVFSDSNLEKARENLVASVERKTLDDRGIERPPCSLMTGFIGTASLMESLQSSGNADLAYCLLQQESYPSWLYSVVNGATTIWERLNSYTREEGFGGNNSMNSFNHYSFGAVGAWMINHSLGIQRDVDHPGFKRFVLEPTPDPRGAMTWAEGYYDSMYGRIESSWRKEGGDYIYEFSVPSNTQAKLNLIAEDESNVIFLDDENAEVLSPKYQGEQGGRMVYQLSPGAYRLKVIQD